jgi:high-affinity nickel-transport protein
MYPVGALFGLGFDTSSKVAVIGVANIHGALMMTFYTSTSLARDTVAITYYSIVLSAAQFSLP